jgi:predicted molibdopterin-dependent oxidoreductase YjgC
MSFIVTGSNTSRNHPIIALQMKAAVRKYGAKLIVVDPRRIEMVDFAACGCPEKAGHGRAVFSAMAHVILKEKLYNQAFIDERTENLPSSPPRWRSSPPNTPRRSPASTAT